MQGSRTDSFLRDALSRIGAPNRWGVRRAVERSRIVVVFSLLRCRIVIARHVFLDSLLELEVKGMLLDVWIWLVVHRAHSQYLIFRVRRELVFADA